MTHTPETVRRCCACSKPADGPYHRNAYCSEHRPSVGRPVTLTDVSAARDMMADGCSLREAAERLDVMSTDLDLELWRWMGRDIPWDQPRRYAPDFEGATA